VESNVLTISINFDDNYYITYTKKEYEHDPVEMVLSSLVLEKLYNISVMFSGTTITIDTDPEDHVLIKVMPDLAKRMKISDTVINCNCAVSTKDYMIRPPKQAPNCEINTRSLLKVMEFCNKNIINFSLTESNKLDIFAESKTILDQSDITIDVKVLKETKNTIQLDQFGINLVSQYLRNLIKNGNVLSYLVFIEKDISISILVNINEIEQVQIYTIHDQ
jgi:hypothetical protein